MKHCLRQIPIQLRLFKKKWFIRRIKWIKRFCFVASYGIGTEDFAASSVYISNSSRLIRVYQKCISRRQMNLMCVCVFLPLLIVSMQSLGVTKTIHNVFWWICWFSKLLLCNQAIFRFLFPFELVHLKRLKCVYCVLHLTEERLLTEAKMWLRLYFNCHFSVERFVEHVLSAFLIASHIIAYIQLAPGR